MSIYIPGIEMPKNCAWCRFLQSTDPIPKRELFCGIDTTNNIHDYKPDKGCPLIPVPEHGRLIDADEFFKALSMDDRVSILEAMHVQSILSDAPTIIPADREWET